jgi:hypothetical protein
MSAARRQLLATVRAELARVVVDVRGQQPSLRRTGTVAQNRDEPRICPGVHGLMHLRISHDPPPAFLALNYIGVILRWI